MYHFNLYKTDDIRYAIIFNELKALIYVKVLLSNVFVDEYMQFLIQIIFGSLNPKFLFS